MTQAADTDIRVGQPEMVTLTIDGVEISVPKGTLVIRAAELMGIQILRFCDHPLLEPVGACRQCLVEVEGQRKPLASCTTVATDDMVVRTQLTSEIADKAQHGVMELLLINHPLDCPMCDKGGECQQNRVMSNAAAFTDSPPGANVPSPNHQHLRAKRWTANVADPQVRTLVQWRSASSIVQERVPSRSASTPMKPRSHSPG